MIEINQWTVGASFLLWNRWRQEGFLVNKKKPRVWSCWPFWKWSTSRNPPNRLTLFIPSPPSPFAPLFTFFSTTARGSSLKISSRKMETLARIGSGLGLMTSITSDNPCGGRMGCPFTWVKYMKNYDTWRIMISIHTLWRFLMNQRFFNYLCGSSW